MTVPPATAFPVQHEMTFRAAAAGAPRVRLRITRRGRAVLTALSAAGAIALAVTVAMGPALVPSPGRDAAYAAAEDAAVPGFEYVTVLAGQSLWEIAERLAPGADPRDVIAEIVALNQLDTAALTAGQRLALPATYTG